MKLRKYTERDIINEAELFLKGTNIRTIAQILNIPKSTVSWHLIKPLRTIDLSLYKQVRKQLNRYAKSQLRVWQDVSIGIVPKQRYTPAQISIIKEDTNT